MTARDRALVLWLRDFIDNELGVVDYRPTVRRLEAAKRMINRWLANEVTSR